MKVLQTMAGAEHGGAEDFFTRLAVALQRAGVDQRVVIRHNPVRAEKLRREGVHPRELSFGGPIDVKSRWAIRREIAEYKPDIVFSWMNRAAAMCPKGKFTHIGRLGGYYKMKYYRNCDHLVANTEDIAGYLARNGWPPEKIHFLPNFVHAGGAKPIKREDYYTPYKTPLILAMGRLHENKAFDTLLEAVARVPDVYLWLAGDGPLRGELEAQAERLGIKPRVRFLGWCEDTGPLLAAADIFVCPSRHEPLGNVVIEAWAHSVPVVAADSLGPGTLLDQGDSGLLVPVDDAPAMAGAIRSVINDNVLAQHLADHGHAAYQAGFTEKIVVEKYLEFFQRLLT
ncbi:MAG: glycosyltransferase [Rhodospirillales bacterium]|jgi:glycosyltransferase involved in cell wall biosynthesis|nr:glycosyltransferase [Rhodospirillales bacterium]